MATSKFQSKWDPVRELYQRSLGFERNNNFRAKASGARCFVQRLTLSHELQYHDGCVNTLNFSPKGDLIASGSDDMHVAIWDWTKCHKDKEQKPRIAYNSGHTSNVFQAKFMPNSMDSTIITCARDGQVRVGFLSSTDNLQQTKRIAQHRGAAHKLAVEPGSSHLLLTCGEDAVVFDVDLREPKPKKLFCLHNEKKKKVALYSISINPSNPFEFAVSGRDQFARIFDRRKIQQEGEKGILKKFCPDHLKESDAISLSITCLMYNYNGSELLTSYNDEDIYLFDTFHSCGANHIHRYSGHRNSQTVKGVNFFGPQSEYIVSGSDCSHIYLWDKESEDVVQFLEGDKGGVVNVLEPHPFYSVLATSGLDHDVKIWMPTAEGPTKLDGLDKQVKENMTDREQESDRQPDPFGERLLAIMLAQLRRRQRQARARRHAENRSLSTTGENDSGNDDNDDDSLSISSDDSDNENDDDDDNDDDNNEDDDGFAGRVQCTQA